MQLMEPFRWPMLISLAQNKTTKTQHIGSLTFPWPRLDPPESVEGEALPVLLVLPGRAQEPGRAPPVHRASHLAAQVALAPRGARLGILVRGGGG